MNEPKFVEGEIVNVRSALLPEYNEDGAVIEEVINGIIGPDGGIIITAVSGKWFYKLVGQDDCCAAYKEESLRKLPPNEKTEWEDCIWSPEIIKKPVSLEY